MNFALSPELADLRERVRAFMNDRVLPNEKAIIDEDRVFQYGTLNELRQQAKEAGLWTPHLPPAFGGLGLFPTYFALSQEVSVEHQGKVTGVLGASAHFSLSAIYPIEGLIADATGSKALVLGIVGTAPVIGLVALLWHWSPKREARRDAAQTSA